MTCTVRSVGKNSASRAISTIRHLLLWSVWATLAALALPSAAPAAGFSSAAPMSGARYLATATLLPTGRVLVAGGQGSAGYLASAELYDPSANSWSAAGTLGAARASAVALLLPNGKVLVAGGYGATGAVASAELYDPATNSWSGGGTFVDARAYATATLLHNGRVLVAGGQGSAGRQLRDGVAPRRRVVPQVETTLGVGVGRLHATGPVPHLRRALAAHARPARDRHLHSGRGRAARVEHLACHERRRP